MFESGNFRAIFLTLLIYGKPHSKFSANFVMTIIKQAIHGSSFVNEGDNQLIFSLRFFTIYNMVSVYIYGTTSHWHDFRSKLRSRSSGRNGPVPGRERVYSVVPWIVFRHQMLDFMEPVKLERLQACSFCSHAWTQCSVCAGSENNGFLLITDLSGGANYLCQPILHQLFDGKLAVLHQARRVDHHQYSLDHKPDR